MTRTPGKYDPLRTRLQELIALGFTPTTAAKMVGIKTEAAEQLYVARLRAREMRWEKRKRKTRHIGRIRVSFDASGNVYYVEQYTEQGYITLGCSYDLSYAMQRARRSLPRKRRGTLRGVRAWILDVRADGPYLRSMTTKFIADGPVITSDRKPARGNSSGIYSFSMKPNTYRAFAAALREEAQYGSVIIAGYIDIWGKIVEHRFGYRSEHAVIRQLMLYEKHMWPPLVEGLSTRYQCEVKEITQDEHWRRGH